MRLVRATSFSGEAAQRAESPWPACSWSPLPGGFLPRVRQALCWQTPPAQQRPARRARGLVESDTRRPGESGFRLDLMTSKLLNRKLTWNFRKRVGS